MMRHFAKNFVRYSHPINIHGHEFLVTRKGGKRLPPAAQSSEVTVLVAPGETRDIEFIADNPGDWALHCHKSHHVINQMQHDLPNLIGINTQGIEERIKKFFPEFMGLMNINGMGEMFDMYGTRQIMDMGIKMKYPSNLSPIGSPGPFGVIEIGGMFTIFKVRDNLTSYVDPGWYQHPLGTTLEVIYMGDMSDMHDNISEMNTQNSTNNINTVSWFSKNEDQKERYVQENINWMQSKPEDSMSGQMQHGAHSMKGMSHDMSNTKRRTK